MELGNLIHLHPPLVGSGVGDRGRETQQEWVA